MWRSLSWGLPMAATKVEESLEPWSLGRSQGSVLIAPGHKLSHKLALGGKVKMRGTWADISKMDELIRGLLFSGAGGRVLESR